MTHNQDTLKLRYACLLNAEGSIVQIGIFVLWHTMCIEVFRHTMCGRTIESEEIRHD